MDSVNSAMIINLHKTTQSSLTILDSNINIIGGVWNANGDRQKRLKIDNTPISGFSFFGIKKSRIENVRLENTSTPTVNNISVTPYYNDLYYRSLPEEAFIEKNVNWARLRDLSIAYSFAPSITKRINAEAIPII